MNKIYMIYEEGFGHTGITFQDEESASQVVELLNDSINNDIYSVVAKTLYSDLDEYIKDKKEDILKNFDRALRILKNGSTLHAIKLNGATLKLSYNDIKEAVETNRLKIKAFYRGDYKYTIEDNDINAVISKYHEINKKIKMYEYMIKGINNDPFLNKKVNKR